MTELPKNHLYFSQREHEFHMAEVDKPQPENPDIFGLSDEEIEFTNSPLEAKGLAALKKEILLHEDPYTDEEFQKILDNI